MIDEVTRGILAQVDQRALIDLAGALIRIPSFKTEETPVARFLDRFFRERGYDVVLQEIEPGRFQTICQSQSRPKPVSVPVCHLPICAV